MNLISFTLISRIYDVTAILFLFLFLFIFIFLAYSFEILLKRKELDEFPSPSCPFNTRDVLIKKTQVSTGRVYAQPKINQPCQVEKNQIPCQLVRKTGWRNQILSGWRSDLDEPIMVEGGQETMKISLDLAKKSPNPMRSHRIRWDLAKSGEDLIGSYGSLPNFVGFIVKTS